jgi:hypothetical protein
MIAMRGGLYMITTVVYNDQEIQVHINDRTKEASIQLLLNKMIELEYSYSEFSSKLKRIQTIQLIEDVAIFSYIDGTQLYMQFSNVLH